jgi:hypothetical protein
VYLRKLHKFAKANKSNHQNNNAGLAQFEFVTICASVPLKAGVSLKAPTPLKAGVYVDNQIKKQPNKKTIEITC